MQHNRGRHGPQRADSVQVARQDVHQAFPPQLELRVEHLEGRDGDQVRIESRSRARTPVQDRRHHRRDGSRDGTRCESAPCGEPQPSWPANRRRQCLGELRRSREPVRGCLRQRSCGRRIHRRRDRLPQPPHRRHRIREPLRDHDLGVRTRVRRLPREHLVQHARETVDVAPPVDRPTPARLLRTHVRRRPDGDARLRQPRPRRLGDRACDPEVRHHRLAPRQQDVLRLDVPVHHVVPVGVAQRACYFPGDPQRLVKRQRPFPLEPVAQRLAFDIRHDVIEEPRRFP